MKFQMACGSLAALVMIAAPAAKAADFSVGSDGSVKDMSPVPAVAVPAPVPIPEYRPSWYFRLDAGIGSVGDPDFTERGYQYGGLVAGANGYPGSFADGPTLQDLDPTWFTSDFSNLSTFGGGVGYYLGGGWRLDATVEKRSNDQAYISGTETWDSHSYYDGPDLDAIVDTYGTDPNNNAIVDRRTTLTVNDRIDIDGTIWMVNAYRDLGTHRGFTPYLGAGIGLVWNEFDRSHTTRLQSCDNEAPCGGTTVHTDLTETASADKVSLAAAAMAGFSYQITDITSVDVGYRYLYMGGTDFVMSIAGVESRVEFGDQHIHQLRAGLRFDVN